MRIDALVITPIQPSDPSMRWRRSRPHDSRPHTCRWLPVPCFKSPSDPITFTDLTMSSMLPYLFRFMPLALVAIQPPKVLNSMLSGS